MAEKKSLIKDYLYDRRGILLLFFLSLGVFFLVAALERREELFYLGYSALLAAFMWACFGVADYLRYRGLRRKLLDAEANLEQASEVLASKGDPAGEVLPVDRPGRLERHYERLIDALCRDRARILAEEETERSQRNDYYLMWAHQIKTPIAAMKLLLEGKKDFLMSQELFQVEQYVEMVLYYLRLESMSSDMLLQEYSLDKLVKDAVKKFSILFINSGLGLEMEDFGEKKILTDEKWLGFVLEQILANSLKYTLRGKIAVYLSREEAETLVIEDTGIGIRPEDLPRIFERGFTGYNGRLDQKATGIGLYLVKRVLDHLNTPIRVESRVGVGTKVSLSLGRRQSLERNGNA